MTFTISRYVMSMGVMAVVSLMMLTVAPLAQAGFLLN